MKKIYFILIAAALFLAVDANAQIGVGLGYNLLTTTATMADESEDDSLNGFYLEATYDFNFLNKNWGSLGLQPGVRYTFAGESDSDEVAGVKAKESFTEHYLDVPVNVKYSYEIIPTTLKAYAFAGMHILSDKVPDIMEEYVNERGLDDSAPARFPIIDFYLWAASRWPIYGALVEDLHLLDVGKLDALDAAEKFIQETR